LSGGRASLVLMLSEQVDHAGLKEQATHPEQ
jgi:hypothetical protein